MLIVIEYKTWYLENKLLSLSRLCSQLGFIPAPALAQAALKIYLPFLSNIAWATWAVNLIYIQINVCTYCLHPLCFLSFLTTTTRNYRYCYNYCYNYLCNYSLLLFFIIVIIIVIIIIVNLQWQRSVVPVEEYKVTVNQL